MAPNVAAQREILDGDATDTVQMTRSQTRIWSSCCWLGSPFALRVFGQTAFERDPQVVTHFMILRGSHHSLDSTSRARRRNAKDEWVIKLLVINLAQEYL